LSLGVNEAPFSPPLFICLIYLGLLTQKTRSFENAATGTDVEPTFTLGLPAGPSTIDISALSVSAKDSTRVDALHPQDRFDPLIGETQQIRL
jgi:hypothetical protein